VPSKGRPLHFAPFATAARLDPSAAFHANEETAPRSDSIAIEILRAFPVPCSRDAFQRRVTDKRVNQSSPLPLRQSVSPRFDDASVTCSSMATLRVELGILPKPFCSIHPENDLQ
jgi:hypothetical protein